MRSIEGLAVLNGNDEFIRAAVAEKLQRVRLYLAGHTYAGEGEYLSFRAWYQTIENAVEILDEARSRVLNPQEDIVVIVVDLDAVERRLIAALIADEDVVELLPFQASVGWGQHYAHIRNESAYVIETNAHEIPPGETLCARGVHTTASDLKTIPTCPGCLAKAKNLIAWHVTQ